MYVSGFLKFHDQNLQQVVDINLSQVAQPKLADWSTTHYHDNNVIGYLPKSKELIIVNL